MSSFIYLVVLQCTGRTCNAHPVIGGDVVASSWYVDIYFKKKTNMYVLLYCIFYYIFCLLGPIFMKFTQKVYFIFFYFVAVVFT